ncbi:TonB family protein [Pontibacter litorisediminis]|uniref:TonB family protein n=1 Tax=Pontibacter litorisediminis TaxID=1846260 RepID=UPI0023EC9D9E|nr:TonB family protein [Pontibacter litorisediminis]
MKKKDTFIRLVASALLSMATLAAAPAAFAQTADKPYTYVEQMPVFKGGDKGLMQFLGTNIKYPEDAVKAGVEGLVVVTFVIDTDGSVKSAQVVKPLSSSTDAEAVRVIKLMDGMWQPGKQNGKIVAVKYTLPIRFAMKTEPAEAAAPDQQPQFKGGQQALMQTLHQHLKLPEAAKQEHLNARVVVKFTVEKDGTVSNIKLASTKLKKTVGPDTKLDYMDASTFNLQNKTIVAKLAEAAAAAVKATSGQWQPATKNGQPVAAEIALPVQFLGSEADPIDHSLPSPASQQEASSPAKAQPSASAHPDREFPKQLAKFFAKNLRYPGTDAESVIEMEYEMLENGTLHYVLGKNQNRELQDEVLRVLKLAKEERFITYNGKGLQTLAVWFKINDATTKSLADKPMHADVVVTKYK